MFDSKSFMSHFLGSLLLGVSLLNMSFLGLNYKNSVNCRKITIKYKILR
jgi:uncharacterized membrane protein